MPLDGVFCYAIVKPHSAFPECERVSEALAHGRKCLHTSDKDALTLPSVIQRAVVDTVVSSSNEGGHLSLTHVV